MNNTQTTSTDNLGADIINITSLVAIIAGLVLNIWQTLMMKNIKLESECCKSCLIELSEND